ncbi:DNA-directed RNA polymerase [Microdochium bolleyi]|uniref:DNA-directed RNA polymerase n=1 Tax=Microdochium bolleyi TaxID=196109 RepID=A0A136J5R3_9PEZI|nr:DNA-directed RNA polymerase [Microdochium bolleyi]
MLVRTRSLHRGVSLASLHRPVLRPSLSSHSSLDASIHPSSTRPGSRHIVTRPSLLPWRRKTMPSPSGTSPQRLLATAMDDPVNDTPFDRIKSPGSSYQNPVSPPPLYNLRSFDPARPLHLSPAVDTFPATRATALGVPGGIEEMYSVFDACLLVGKPDRAALVLERFRNMNVVAPTELIQMHNRYLRASLDQVFTQSNAKWASAMHKWYELHIREHLPQTPETIACMLKASLLSSQGARLNRLVTRYLDMMPDEESIYHVLSEEDILTQQDLGTIISIYQPASKLSLEEMDTNAAALEQEAAADGESLASSMKAAAATVSTTATPSPQVLGVDQKGLGLETLRGVLSFFKDIEDKDLSGLPLAERQEIQARLERDCVDAAIDRWREENQTLRKLGRASPTHAPVLNSQLYDWHSSMEAKLKEEFLLLDIAEESKTKSTVELDRCAYGPFLRQSTPTRLAAVTILSVLGTIATQGADKGVALSTVLTSLAKAVEDDAKSSARSQEMAEKKRLRRRQFRQQATSSGPELPAQDANADKGPIEVKAPLFEKQSWSPILKTKIAAVLMSALIDTAKVTVVREHPETKALVSQVQPAMAHTTVHRKGKRAGVLMPNKFLTEMMKREPRGDFLARHLPMLVEPEPWSGFDKGGFLESSSNLIRVKAGEREQVIYVKAAAERGDLEQVMKGLDVLGRTGWRVNTPVFDVMLAAWNSGQAVANIPALHPDIVIPPEPEATEDGGDSRRIWLKAVKAAENKKSGLHSERCFMNFQLEIARSFKNQTFYFPHNMDFRGRAYPLPTYLNHMGADHVRGLLRFAKGKELGDAGLRWVKIHLSNVFGYDKASFKEREQFAMDHYDDIVDSATNPLNGRRWWLRAEDPWQCLAACFELKAALESPDPTKFVSYLPVHQDGTCNGLQHYAALGGDKWGAQQVNLTPGDRPADVYSAVANLVKESLAADAKEKNFMALALDGKITRKVVKQTVMTNVYGVTFIGAKAQIRKQLDAAYPDLEKEHEIPLNILASYLTTKVFKALSTMFRGAHDIQFWLGECAGRVCRALTPEQLERLADESLNEGSSTSRYKPTMASKLAASKKSGPEGLLEQFRSTIVWTTPLRLPVAQPYRRANIRSIETCLADLNLQIPERTDPVHRRKQLQAFPPNFIHSLDASHMLLSALECDDLGLSFAAVHDSFWTHAADIDKMNLVIRDSFIRIHREDVIGRLASEFEARYGGSLYMTTVERNSPLGKKIVALRKENKLTSREELLREYKRLQLLKSSDPSEVQEAQKMITPAVLFEQEAAEAPLEAADEMQAVGLGSIPASVGHDTKLSDEGSGDEGLAEEKDSSLSRTEDMEYLKGIIEMSSFEMQMAKQTGAKKPARAPKAATIQVWLPLTFPKIPVKGDFDVSELKESKYFFS